MINRIFYLALFLICSCQTSKVYNQGGWHKVFQNDASGEAIYGEKSELIRAVRLGYPIRLGWGGNRVEHIADADFLTIFEEEVFAQIKVIVGQEPRIDNDSVKIRFRMKKHWTKISGTNGYATGFMADYFKDSIVGGGIDRYNSTSWYVLYPNYETNEDALPLWRSESHLWEEWNKNNLK
ncbi:hypothetical protein [uncultured Croceitalea sp.]|uniref:hypothetical protein n=1 Tax=uncultured Croceitalea sp. TaxID=1798908 RepID=UPI003306300D